MHPGISYPEPVAPPEYRSQKKTKLLVGGAIALAAVVLLIVVLVVVGQRKGDDEEEPVAFQKMTFKMFMTDIHDEGSSMTIFANLNSGIWMFDIEGTDLNITIKMGFFSDGSELYIVNDDLCGPESPEFFEQLGFEPVNKMKVNPDVHEKVGQLDYQDSKCDLYNVDPAEDLYVCLYDGFVAVTCDGGLDLTENCQLFTDHEELSSNDARLTLEHHCSSIQKTAFTADFYPPDDSYPDTNVDLFNLKMTMDSGHGSMLFTPEHTYIHTPEMCHVEDPTEDIIFILLTMKINMFTTNTHETKEVLGQTCTIFRTDFALLTVDLCIHDGFLLEHCIPDECVQFNNHQEISAAHPAFTPPEHCVLPESIDQVLVFSADSQTDDGTIENAFYKLEHGILYYEQNGIKNFFEDGSHYSVEDGTCSSQSDWETDNTVMGMIVADSHDVLGLETVNGVECTNYEYLFGTFRTCLSEDGFILRHCIGTQCTTFSNHEEVSSSHANFQLPEECSSEPVHQELFFAATLEREGETFANARFNLHSGLLFWEDAGQDHLLTGIDVYSFDGSNCSDYQDWDLADFIDHLPIPSSGFQYVDDDVIGGVSCKRYAYQNSWGDDITNCVSNDGFVLELCEDNWITEEMECSYLTNHSVISADDSKFELPSHC
ncbi:hypothetical protein GEMRC1_012093 [Eukaryota sp. GEM-RC1]